jgi:leader peptidase (prepilin peptidase)/N-methyltransferase
VGTLAEGLHDFLRSPWGWVFAALWGALWGSFLNVAIHRIGLYESVVRPRSRCPRCGTMVRAVDNIPIVSWLVLRGRCRGCGAPISIRYPLVELLGLGLGLATYWRFVASAPVEAEAPWLLARFFVYFFFAATLVALAGIDLDHLIIPDSVTYPAIPLFFVAALLVGDTPPGELALGPFVGYGIVALFAELAWLILKREGMGYGDAKLLAMVGALLGWRAALVVFFAAPFGGLAVVPPVLLARRKRVIGVEIPYGPFLVVAALAYLYLGQLLPEPLTFRAP